MHVMRGRPESAERHGAGHVARCTVERLMGDLDLRGVRRAKSPRTTRSVSKDQCPADLVRRHFEAFAPGGLWVAGIPPLRGRYPLLCTRLLWVGLCGFRNRRVLAQDHRLADLHRPVHRPGPGRPSDGRLAAETSGGRPDGPGAPLATVGCSTGPSATGRPCPRLRRSPRWGRRATPFGFALAEALNSLYKAELIRNQGPWEGIDAARARHRRVGPLVRAPFVLTPPSGCDPLPSTKPPGHPTPTARNNHNRQPPAPDKPATTKPGA